MSKRRKRAAQIINITSGKPVQEPEVKNAILATQEPIRPVVVMRDSVIDFPQLFINVYISEPSAEKLMAEMFARAGCSRADSPDKADLVVFTGGADVNPALYGEDGVHKQTKFDKDRDDRDMALYAHCFTERIPMLGICRGAQFLHVMNGGKLWQDVDAHVGEHGMTCTVSQTYIDRVSSTHHQMVMPRSDARMKVLAHVFKSQKRWRNDLQSERGNNPDIEAFFYEDTCCLGVQGHPEYRGYTRFTAWTLKQIETYILHHTNVQAENGTYRHKRELIVSA